MQTRLLVYDPDPSARRMIAEGCRALAGLRVSVRASLSTCLRDLARSAPEALLLGLPMEAGDLATLVSAALDLPEPPAVLMAQAALPDGQPTPDGWIEKTPAGLAGLLPALRPHLLERGLRRLAFPLAAMAVGERPLSDVDRSLISLLDSIGYPAAIVRLAPEFGIQAAAQVADEAAELAPRLTGNGGGVGSGKTSARRPSSPDARSASQPTPVPPRPYVVCVPGQAGPEGYLLVWGEPGAREQTLLDTLSGQLKAASDASDHLRRERRWNNRTRLVQQFGQLVGLERSPAGILELLAGHSLQALEGREAVAVLHLPGGKPLYVHRFASAGSQAWQFLGSQPEALRLPGEPILQLARQLDLQEPRLVSPRELGADGGSGLSAEADVFLMLPIRRGDQLYGALAVDGSGLEPDSGEEDRQTALAMADLAAIAIENAATLSDLRRQSGELTSLLSLGIGLSNELTSGGVIDRLLDEIQHFMDVDTAVIARLEEPETLQCDLLDFGRRLPSMRVPLGGPTLSGHVIRTGRPLLIRDYDAEAAGLPVPGLTAGVETASWLGVPLIVRGETIGAISVQSQTPNQFDDDELRLLRMVANHVAISLDNARLLQSASQRAEQLRLVNEIGRYAVSVLDIQLLVREVAQHILRSFQYYAVQILLLEGGVLIPRAVARGPEGELINLGRILTLRDQSLIAEATRNGQPILVPDVSLDPRYLPAPELPNTKAELTVPLMIGHEVVGVLDVQSDQSGGLGPADLELVQALAAQVAISVVNARLFGEVRSHAAELEARVTTRTAEIRSQKERTEAILRSVADAVVVLSLEGTLLLANPVAQDLLSGPQGSAVMAQIGRLHAQGGVVTETLELGELAFQALASPVTQGELAVGTVVVLRDITRLRELDRLKSHFVATVSHELRTPLANIKLYLSLLRRGREERRGQYVQVLEEEAGRLSAMIEDLLDLSRLEARRDEEPSESVELRGLLGQVIESHRPSFMAKAMRVELEDGPTAVVQGRRNQLIQVFNNLLSNAILYTPAGGWVRLRVKRAEATAKPSMASVSVQDSGQGIPEKDLPYIFDRFYRGSQARSSNLPGSGLGLAIVREILERHQGRVTVLSRPGEGSTFTVWLAQREE